MSREIEVGAVLNRVFRVYGEQWTMLIQCAVIVFGTTGIINVLLAAASPALSVLASLLTLVGTFIFTGAIVEFVADIQDNRRDATLGELFGSVMPVLGQLILVGIVAGIGAAIGFVFFVIPGLILLTIWAVAAPVVVLEQPGGLRALGRSRELVRGNGWQVFGVIFVLFVLVAVISLLIAVLFAFTGLLYVIVASVVVIFTAPIQALGAAILYFELRGVQPASAAADYGSDAPAPPPPGSPPPSDPLAPPGLPPPPGPVAGA